MSANTANVSRQQPPWRVPEGKSVPKLKLYNSMTRTKVTGGAIYGIDWDISFTQSERQLKTVLTSPLSDIYFID
jgi:hypothetical protein